MDKPDTLDLQEGISVILPSYKGGKWILKCLESLATQTLDKTLFEVIVIINGEKDNTETLIDDFIEHHNKMNIQKIVSKEADATNAQNVGITHARKQFSTFIDNDIIQNYLQDIYYHNEKHKKITEEIIQYKSRIHYLETELNTANKELNGLQKALGIAKRFKDQFETCRNSASYQLGHLLIHETKSFGDIIRLPKRVKEIKSKKSMSPGILSTLSGQKLISKKARINDTQTKHNTVKNGQIPSFTSEKKSHDLKIACIMDPFTYGSYSHEATFQQLTPENWKDELKTFLPDLLFIESAWRGKDELWWNAVGKKCDELVAIVSYCKKHDIPTVFWNKEDPVHFTTFINTASLFDFVFTTDIDMIWQYKELLQNERVYLLPFACQPKVNNPIEKYERKDAFCFAGAYYSRYPDRTRDLDEYMLKLPQLKPIEIYDRNYGKDDPSYMFPEQFKPFIVGTLPFEEIDKAYKGYNYAINLNSVKQSQSMFARRVYEVLASNTITVSNFSKAVRLLFGDLVVTSDSGTEIVKRIENLTKDDNLLRKHKLVALRKVLSEHTYRNRLSFLASKVFNRVKEDTSVSIGMVCFIQNEDEYQMCLNIFNKQFHTNKNLLIITENFQISQKLKDEKLEIMNIDDLKDQTIASVCQGADYIALIDLKDHYGMNYLTDLVLATHYFDGEVIGKGSHYAYAQEAINLVNSESQYCIVNSIPYAASIIKQNSVCDLSLYNLYRVETDRGTTDLKCLNIDPFNYCKNGYGLSTEQIEFIEANSMKYSGISMNKLISSAEQSLEPHTDEQTFAYCISGVALCKSIPMKKNSDISFNVIKDAVNITSTLTSNDHLRLSSQILLDINKSRFKKSQNIYFDISTGLDTQLTAEYYDKEKEQLSLQIITPNQNEVLVLPENASFIRFGFRIKGPGFVRFNALELDHRVLSPSVLIAQSQHLIITNNYPSYVDLYRNGFVHARVKAYQKHNSKVDVFKLSENNHVSYDEFENVDVTTGSSDALRNLLKNNIYQSILVHFLDDKMWDVLKEYIEKIKVFVWVHGADIQPWHRRKHLFNTTETLEKAKFQSEKRITLWKEVLSEPHKNLNLIFVSQYLADSVMEDLKLDLPKENYNIIHNFINTDLYDYGKKEEAQRKKILSIRPYANKNYANDMSVKAILSLSNKPYFKDLEFRLIGDGVLFDDTLEPLRKFENVIIEKRFLTQEEIASLHKEYGIFLCPSRMDTQGVSRDEAMSSGLVPVTNNITAIPEFVDDSCGILADAEDVHDLAEGIAKLYENPELFQQMSEAAANRVRKQCGFEQTIAQELKLFNPTFKKKN